MAESSGEHETPLTSSRRRAKLTSSRRRAHLRSGRDLPAPADDAELPTESLERYNRPFESGSAATVDSAQARPASRPGASRVRLSTSTSASNGWAARFSKLSGVRREPEEAVEEANDAKGASDE